MKREHLEHLIRTIVIVVLFLAVGAVWVFGPNDPEVKFRVEGVLAALTPAVYDAIRVWRHQLSDRKSLAPPPS